MLSFTIYILSVYLHINALVHITILIFSSFPSPTTCTMYVLSYTPHSTPVPPSPFPLWYVCQVLSHGTALLSSTGEEYSLDNDPDYQNMTAQVPSLPLCLIVYIRSFPTPPAPLTLPLAPSLCPCPPHSVPGPLTLPLPPSLCPCPPHSAPAPLTLPLPPSLCPCPPHSAPAPLTLPLPPKLPRSLSPPQEKTAFYRQQLLQKLGLVAQGKVFSTGIEKFIDDSDLVITSSTRGSPQPTAREV